MIKIQVNGVQYEVPNDLTIMEACKRIGVYIPSLCYHSDVPSGGNCGLCIVKVDGSSYTHACMMNVRPGMIINTTDKDIIEKQKTQFDRFIDISHIPKTPDIEDVIHYFYPKKAMHVRQNEKTDSISFNSAACINCQICERVCADVIDIGALNDPTVSIKNSKCISCGLCSSSCPTSAISETSSLPKILSSLVNKDLTTVLIVDPAVIFSMNDAFTDDKKYGIECSEKIVGAAKTLGFNFVYDNRFSSDFISLQMTEELIKRINSQSGLPMINSNCPALINDIEKSLRELIPNLSLIKPPQHILARAIKKTCQKHKTESIFIVHLTSCVGSKTQINRMQLVNDIDAVITTREFIQLIDSFGIEWNAIKPSQFDTPYKNISGASSLSAISGGLTTSILRNIFDKYNNDNPSKASVDEFPYKIDNRAYNQIEIKTHRVKIDESNKEIDLKVAVCNGISAFHQLVADEQTMNKLHFVEVMACPGGCIYGGGQPKLNSKEIFAARIDSITKQDKMNKVSSPFANRNDVEMHINLPLHGTISGAKSTNHAVTISSSNSKVAVTKFNRSINYSASKHGMKTILRPAPLDSLSYNLSLSNQNTGNNSNFNIDTFNSVITTHYEPQELAASKKSRKNLSTTDLPIVAYGSTYGKAMRFARYIASFFKTSSSCLNSIDLEKIKLRKKIFIIISSQDDGNYPINASKFIEEITKNPRDLSEVSFAILGIDDAKKSGDKFCQSASKLNELLVNLKAKPIIDTFKIDVCSFDGGESTYSKWISSLKDALFIDKEPIAGVQLINELKKVENDDTVANKPSRPNGFEIAEISEKVLMSEPDSSPKITKVVISLPEGLSYELGDQVFILPCNDKEIVDSVINSLQYVETDVFNFSSSGGGSSIVPDKVTVRQLFTQYLDLNGIPPSGIYQTFYNSVVNENSEEGKKLIEPLLDEKGEERRKFQLENNASEAIIEFSKYAKPPLDALVSSLNIMQPRLYSVSSTPEETPGKAELLVNQILFKSGSKQRYGLCSHFLTKPDLSKVAINFRRGKFKYPKDVTTDVIFVGLGSGLAPIMPLIQLRGNYIKEGKKLGKALLFFGARYKGSYQRLFSKMEAFIKEGVVTQCFYAFSRDPEKQHVQDVMKKNAEKIWEIWQDPRTCVFFSGPDKGIPEQLKDIMVDITIHEGWMAMEEAMAYNSRHEWHIEGL